MPSRRLPIKAIWLAFRDTGLAMALAILLSTPFLYLAASNLVSGVLDPETLPTCTTWELTVPTIDTPEAIGALRMAEEQAGAPGVTFELLEKEGAAWLKGCFPDGTGDRQVGTLLDGQGLFAGRVSIEWPDLTDRILPKFTETLQASLIPVALATPLAFGLTAIFFIRRRRLRSVDHLVSTSRAILVGLLAGGVGYLLVTLAELGLAAVGLPQEEQAWITLIVEGGGPTLVAFIVFAILIGPLGEELYFRRYLFEALDRSSGRAWAYGLSALIFGLIHMNPTAMISYLLTGLLLAAVYDRTRSLTAAVVAHGCFNALTLAQLVL